jgi:hypothetical protein
MRSLGSVLSSLALAACGAILVPACGGGDSGSDGGGAAGTDAMGGSGTAGKSGGGGTASGGKSGASGSGTGGGTAGSGAGGSGAGGTAGSGGGAGSAGAGGGSSGAAGSAGSSGSSGASGNAGAAGMAGAGGGGAGGSAGASGGGAGGSSGGGSAGAAGTGGAAGSSGGAGSAGSSGASGSGGSAGSAGGAGASGASGAAGTGGSAGAGGAAGSAGAAGAGGSAGASGFLLALGTGNGIVTAAQMPAGGAWTTQSFMDGSPSRPSLAFAGIGTAVGVFRSVSMNELRVTTWTPGTWTTPSILAANVTTNDSPGAATASGHEDVVFLGTDNKHYFASHGASWSPTAEAVGGVAAQSFGPSAATITTLGTSSVIAFAGNDHDLYDQTRAGGTWQAAHAHGLGNYTTMSQAIVAPASGASDLLVVFVRASDKAIVFTKRTGANWSAPAQIEATAFTSDTVSLVALPDGSSLLAFRGQDQHVYWSRYTSAWSTPAAVVAAAPKTPAPPAVAVGLPGVDAELAYVDSADGSIHHTRLTGTTWSAPTKLSSGGGLTSVALARTPLATTEVTRLSSRPCRDRRLLHRGVREGPSTWIPSSTPVFDIANARRPNAPGVIANPVSDAMPSMTEPSIGEKRNRP